MRSPARPGSGLIPHIGYTNVDAEPFYVGKTCIQPIPMRHGSIRATGYRIGNFAYLTDTSGVPASSRALLRDLDVLVVDCPALGAASDAPERARGAGADRGRRGAARVSDARQPCAGARGDEPSRVGPRASRWPTTGCADLNASRAAGSAWTRDRLLRVGSLALGDRTRSRLRPSEPFRRTSVAALGASSAPRACRWRLPPARRSSGSASPGPNVLKNVARVGVRCPIPLLMTSACCPSFSSSSQRSPPQPLAPRTPRRAVGELLQDQPQVELAEDVGVDLAPAVAQRALRQSRAGRRPPAFRGCGTCRGAGSARSSRADRERRRPRRRSRRRLIHLAHEVEPVAVRETAVARA